MPVFSAGTRDRPSHHTASVPHHVISALQARKDLLVTRESQDQTVLMEKMADQVFLVLHFLPPTTFLAVALSARLDLLDHLDLMDLREMRDQLVHQDVQEHLADPDPLAQLENPESPDHQAQKDVPDNLDPQAKTAREERDHKDPKDPLDHVDHPASPAKMEKKVPTANLENKVPLDDLERTVDPEKMVAQDQLVPQDCLDQTHTIARAHPAVPSSLSNRTKKPSTKCNDPQPQNFSIRAISSSSLFLIHYFTETSKIARFCCNKKFATPCCLNAFYHQFLYVFVLLKFYIIH